MVRKFKKLSVLFACVTVILTGCSKNKKEVNEETKETTEYSIYVETTERTTDELSGQYMVITSDIGDEFNVSINNKKTNTLSYNEADGVISINSESGEVLQSGCFLNTRWYKEYYDAVTNECNIISYGSSANVDYIFYSYTITENNNEKTMYEFLGWIIGSNTGIVWEAGNNEDEALRLFSDLWFEVKTTDQQDEYFVTDPDTIETENNDIEFSVDENGRITYKNEE